MNNFVAAQVPNEDYILRSEQNLDNSEIAKKVLKYVDTFQTNDKIELYHTIRDYLYKKILDD